MFHMPMLITTEEMRGLSSLQLEKIWTEQLKNMMGTSFKDEKSSALRIAMVVRGPEPTQEVDPDLSQDPDLGPKEDQLPGAEVAPNPGQSPDPSQEVNPRIVLISEVAQDPGLSLDPNPEVNPRIVRISAEDLGQDLLEKNLDHDLPEINLGPDLLRREGDPGLVRINPGPDPTMASPSPDLVQSLRTHADAKVGQSLKLRVNHAQDLQRMIQ